MSKTDRINRMQINLSDRALKEIEELKDQIDVRTRTEVVKSSIKVFKFLEDRKAEGGRVIIRDKDGNDKEIIF